VYVRDRFALFGKAVVTGNTARYGGGLYTYGADLTLREGASVSANTATEAGGVYNGTGSALTLLDEASVTSNVATTFGGIENVGSVVLDAAWTGTVCGNTPDDWPGCT
jgi:hypothetical protein